MAERLRDVARMPGGLDAGARRTMQVGLAQTFFWLMAVTSAALAVRAATGGGPWVAAVLSLLTATATLVWSYRDRAPVKVLALALFCVLVLLIGKAAMELDGAAGAPLAFAYTPGYVAMLVVGPIWGWVVAGLMLATMGALAVVRPAVAFYDRLRFIDELAMTVFAAGLGHFLIRSFRAYETAIRNRAAALLRLDEDRAAMVRAIYERLEPMSASLEHALADQPAVGTDRQSLRRLVDPLIDNLKSAKVVFGQTTVEVPVPDEPHQTIRRDTMRVWLRLAAVLMLFFVVRNAAARAPFAPSIITIGSCLLLDLWLSRPAAQSRLELTALAIGLLASGPMILHIHQYGASADAPPLVVTPATVLFTTLLSQGPATWLVLLLQVGILAWVGVSSPMSPNQFHLLENIALSFLIVLCASRCVFVLRNRYARQLLQQGQQLAEAARQRRRLAGTLFHDVSNHLLALSMLIEYQELAPEVGAARSLAARVRRLIGLSKEFLLPDEAAREPRLEPIRVGEAVESLKEAFGPRLTAKRLRVETGGGHELSVRAQADLFIESVLGNLLSNAIKFSTPGALITLDAEQVDSHVRIVVSDQGPGFPAEIIGHLDDEGALPSRLGTAGEMGQGFGLQLAVEHLHRMNGRLELRNREGGGATAVVWLPAFADAAPSRAGAARR